MALHIAYQETPALRRLLAAWDEGIAGEGPLGAPPLDRHGPLAGRPERHHLPAAPASRATRSALTDVDTVLAGHPGERSTPDMRDVLNYNAALDLANAAALRPDFEWSQELLRRLNATILAGLPDDERGEYRTGPVTVGGIFVPPEASRLPALMRELVEWLRDGRPEQPTLVRAGLTHLNVVSIHPWTNGNGRTARVAGSLALMRRGSPHLSW